MDASDGTRVTTLEDDECEQYFGCAVDALPSGRCRVCCVRAGGRGGKTSRLIAPAAIHCALTVPTPLLQRGEEAFAYIVAPYRDLAHQAFAFVRGYVLETPSLRARLAGDPTAEEIRVRRDDGNIACIKVVAAGRGGAQLRARTTVFAALDEAALFRDSANGQVNDEDVFGAVAPRVVDGGQIWIVSTPWVAGVGLIEKLIQSDWGTHEQALCAIAPTRALFPGFDPSGRIEATERPRDPDNWDREILAIPQSAGSQLFFDPPAIDAAIDDERPLVLPYDPTPHFAYGAGGDFAFKRDSSAYAIVRRHDDLYVLCECDERRPEKGAPLKPSAIVGDFAARLQAYGISELMADSHFRDTVTESLAEHGMSAIPAPEGQGGKAQTYVFVRSLFREGKIVIPNHPRLLHQMRGIVAKPAPGGGLSITSPRRRGPDGGGHGDLVSAFVLAVWRAHQATSLGDAHVVSVIGVNRDPRATATAPGDRDTRFDSRHGW